jgi:serine O-acetyltransferase
MPFARFLYFRNQYKYGISIPFETQIGSGFYIGHFGGIFISSLCVIGRDVNISQDVTIGRTVRNGIPGSALIGDRVYIGPGAKVVGAVRIGDDVAIGANCVVTRDAIDSSIVAGVPGRTISEGKGSIGYINRTNYPPYCG